MQTYRHYKGGYYSVIAHAREEATGNPVVVYMNAKFEVFTRPLDEFYGIVVVYGVVLPRFEQV